MVMNFFKHAILSYKALYSFSDPKLYILIKVINPILQLIFFTLLASYVYQSNDLTPWVIGNAFLLSVLNAFFGVGNVILTERRFGTLILVITSASNNFFIFMSRAFFHIFDAFVTVTIGLTIGAVVFNVDFSDTNFFLLSIVIIISMFAAIGLGLLIGCLGLLIKDINLILNAFSSLLMIMTGALFSIQLLPPIIQYISYCLPLKRGIEASRMMVNGIYNNKLYELLLQEFLLGCIYMVMGFVLLKVIEKIARVNATLELD
jgi:ABC-2 type transport system permease protein